MKIGILTFHRSINYGAFMQSYALSTTLQKRYPQHTVEVIDFEYLKKHNNYKKHIKRFPFGFEYYIKYTRFQSDLKYLSLSPTSFITDDEESVRAYIEKNYDIVIVGSDAVWAYQKKMPVTAPYFLFGDKLKNIVKMSFAASAFTTVFENATQEEKDILKESLSDFSYIGVRDNATKNFVEKLQTGKHVNINHDPTIFLAPAAPSEKYLDSILHKNLIWGQKSTISFMTRQLACMEELRRKYSNGYRLLHFYQRDNQFRDIKDLRCRLVNNLSPLEWYNLYSTCTLNITHFFHGACLGLINMVPTIAIDDSTVPYMSKYAQLMTDLGLTENLFYQRSFDSDKFFNRMEYLLNNKVEEQERIKRALEKERLKSQSFFDFLDDIL